VQQNRLFSIISHDLRSLLCVEFSQVLKEKKNALTNRKKEFVIVYETSKNTFYFNLKANSLTKQMRYST
jgi:hypothetical protein